MESYRVSAFFGLSMMACFVLSATQSPTLSPEEEIQRIRELARMIRQTDSQSELTIDNLLQWLQGRHQASGVRRARQRLPSREYLPSLPGNSSNNGINKPRPFQRPQQTERPYLQPSDQPGFDLFSPGTTSTSGQQEFKYQRPSYQHDDIIPSQGSTVPPINPSTNPPSFLNYQPSVTPAFEADESDKQDEVGQFLPDDLSHPPHIHSLDVKCAKDMMAITVEFDRVFDGVIYSKGFFNLEKCRYVRPNSGQQRYTFTVSLDSCGTQFVDQLSEGGHAYLENVLVMQNEPGIQEVWDTARSVRCLWEGSIRQDISASLVIGMLAQEVVTFSDETGKARLDIQLGKGPFAKPANGLVKIGDLMTLVVYVEGDSDFDIAVRQCRARDSAGVNSIQLFDERGCVLKPKLFGAFQKTRETGNTGASIIAYAYFFAFKFPDEMDIIIECNVELCKNNCEMCPENQKLEPGRKRRDVSHNETIGNYTNKISGRFRVVAEDDLTELNLNGNSISISYQSLLVSSFFLISLLIISFITSVVMWFKLQKIKRSKC